MQGKLTLKQRKFWKAYCETHNLAKSAECAGSKGKDIKSLSYCGHLILESLGLSMPELLEAKGLGKNQLSEVLSDQLHATKPLIATWEGKITDERLYPDNAAIGKASELLSRMHGVLIDRQELTGKDGGDIILAIKPALRKGESKKIDLDVE